MEAHAQRFYSVEEYLALEQETGIRYEYLVGEVYAMSGGSPAHNRLQFNLSGALYAQLRGSPCKGYSSDQRVWIESEEVYTYPDLLVVCGPPELDRHQSLKNPTLLAEVLSPATEAYDRGTKLHLYRQLPSLRHYVLISQERRLVHVYSREADGRWTFEELSRDGERITLEAIACNLTLTDLYDGVEVGGGR